MKPTDREGIKFWVWSELRKLRELGVTKALTLWPEWTSMITLLDKRVENRGWAPPAGTVGSRIALHAGANVGGRKGRVARLEGLESIMTMAGVAGWTIDPVLERNGLPSLRWSEVPEGGFAEADVRTIARCYDGRPPPGVRSCLEFTKAGRLARLDTNQIPLSAIVAHARVASVINPERLPGELSDLACQHPWYVVGEFGWVLDDVVVLEESIPMQGSQGLWLLPDRELP